jgi:threonine synthase
VSRLRGLVCRECGHLYGILPIHVCEFCFGPLEVAYDYDVIRSQVSREAIAAGPPTIWRYRSLLPVDDEPIIETYAGFTPLVKAENLGRLLGLNELYVKNDTVNPTFSFKDRPVAIAATRARAFGFDTIACASTGNLAAAVAACGARASMRAVVFIPADLEQSKIINTAIYEPTLVAVTGNYDEVNRLCSEIADKYGWAFVNINVRPYYSEGSKTLAFEVAEQLGWRAPDHAIVPTGSGSMFTKIWKGFQELHKVGLIEPPATHMTVAQAAGCAPMVDAFDRRTLNVAPVKPATVAKSLAIGNPADGYYSLKVIKETGGHAVRVSDAEIVEGMKLLARTEGIFGETAGGVSVAVTRKLAESGQIGRDEVTVIYVTGNGLKTPEAVADHLAPPITIAATMEAFEETLEQDRSGAAAVA